MKTCTIDDCRNEHRSRGMCATHWSRWRKHGDPRRVISYAERRKPAEERFWAKVDKDGPGGCWVWTGAIADTGYGVFNIGDKLDNAHRTAYRWLVGEIPPGLHLDHLCMVKACCNPAHLEPVTPRENSWRAEKIGHAHKNAPKSCQRGHDWSVTPPYLAHRSDGSVSRTCRVCLRRSAQRIREEKHGTPQFFAGLEVIRQAALTHQTLTVETTREAMKQAGVENRRVSAVWTAAEARGYVRISIPASESTTRSIHAKPIAVYESCLEVAVPHTEEGDAA